MPGAAQGISMLRSASECRRRSPPRSGSCSSSSQKCHVLHHVRHLPRENRKKYTMDMNRLTQKSQQAMQEAQSKALRYGHVEIDSEHLLLALLEQQDGLLPRLLTRMDVPVAALKSALEQALERRPRVSGPGVEPGKIYVTQRLQKLFVQAEDEAKRLKDEYISVEHLTLALIDEDTCTVAGRQVQAGKTIR